MKDVIHTWFHRGGKSTSLLNRELFGTLSVQSSPWGLRAEAQVRILLHVISLHKLLTTYYMSQVEVERSFSEKQTVKNFPFSWFLNLPSILLKAWSFRKQREGKKF